MKNYSSYPYIDYFLKISSKYIKIKIFTWFKKEVSVFSFESLKHTDAKKHLVIFHHFYSYS